MSSPLSASVEEAPTESATIDFKAGFDVQWQNDWCEVVKDVVAMANSGGGLIVFGVNDDGTPSRSDPQDHQREAGQRVGDAGPRGLRPGPGLRGVGRGGDRRGGAARKKTTAGTDEERLAAAVATQDAKVRRAAERFVDSDGSAAVKAVLAREEAKLRDLRRHLAELSTVPAPRPVDLRQAARAFEDVEALVQVDPAAARARLARFLEPVVLTPDETGYAFDITLRTETAALAGGRVSGESGCGGRI